MTHDSLGDLSMKPSRDELAERAQHRTSKPSRNSGGQPPGNRPVAPVVAANTGPLWALVIFTLVLGGAGGWYLWDKVERLQVSLSQSTQALNTAEQSLSTLQQSLDNRDKTLSKSGDQMTTDIKELNSEVRKLWDVANKRNKAALDELEKSLAKVQVDMKSQSIALDKKLSASTDSLGTIRQSLDELQSSENIHATVLDKQKSELARLTAQFASSGDMDDRVTALEVAIKAIDAHRKQINGRLDQLDQQLGQLYKKPATP